MLVPGPAGTRFGEIAWFEQIDSTNRYLLDQARSGAPGPLVAVADRQSAGRGRLGRVWQAPAGASLLVSVMVRPTVPVERWPQLLGACGVAAVAVITELCDVPAKLKWPNDVVVHDKKLGGLLAEVAGDAVVLGMGLNLDWSSFPSDIANTATAVSMLGGRVQPQRVVLHAWLRRLDWWLREVERSPEGFALLQWHQRARSATLGRDVRVELPDAELLGRAVDLTPHGELIVQTSDGERHIVAVGDIVHLRALDSST